MDSTELEKQAAEREQKRLAALEKCDVFNPLLDGPLTCIACVASYLFAAPVGIVTIVRANSIEYRSRVGIDLTTAPREPGFSASAIMSDDPWIIEDTLADPMVARHSLVDRPNGIRFYAGKAIKSNGYAIGAVSVLDYAPRKVGRKEIAGLNDLANIASTLIEFHPRS